MATQVLRMKFRTEGGNAATISLQNPIDNPEVEDVTEVMDAVIDYDIFDTSTGSITEKVSATLIKTETEEIAVF
ncbi:MAG TPA: DUF2922 domain-containing protein [Firmicutes bacterium]|jgi:hypothetical protein|nr:DUF2922 domain-containing protein [Bacillota bacterium]